MFRVMGPVELWANGRRWDLGTAKERCILAALLLTPRQPVSAETLIHCLWDDNPPAKPRQSLYSYMTRLRHRLNGLAGADLKSRQGNYLIDVEDEAVDLHRFRLLRIQARAIAGSGDDEYALEHYRQAAALWRGTPLAGLSGDWVDRTRQSLEEELLGSAFERIDIELHRGHHADVVGELSGLAERHPFDERPVERLMVALFRSGRQADALEVYRRTRDRLASELGTDTGLGLRQLQQRILQADPALLRVPGTQLVTGRAPNNLPPDVYAFTGREEELRQMMEAAPPADGPGPSAPAAGSAVTVIALDGMAGVGKSALAVHFAHSLSGRFPDGCVYLQLHANDPGHEPLDPASALDTLLRVVGVPAARIPRTLDERAALWRSHLAGCRAIIVLDDAAGHDQVRPLLPASAGCLVIVTSRRRLSGLHDSHPVSLDVLPVEDAVALFTSIAGSGRAVNDSQVTAVVGRCGRLPLAVRIAASRLKHRRAWSVADLLARLTSDDRRLDELRVEGSEISLVFEVSYRGLPPPLRDAFRALGLHPGPELTSYAAAAMLGCSVDEAEQVLEELLDQHLIIEPSRGRYHFHDLVHDFARRLAGRSESDDERRGTCLRLLDFYVAAADRADRLIAPHRRRVDVRVSCPPLALPPMETEAQAREWFQAEHDGLLNAAHRATLGGWQDHVAKLACVLAWHLESRGHWEAAALLHERAISAWEQIGDQRGRAQALTDLSVIRFRSCEYDAALENAGEALEIYRSLSELAGEADVLDHMSLVHWHRSCFAEALQRCQEALEIRRSLGDRRGEARCLDHAAIFLEYTGEYGEAVRLRDTALAIFDEIADPRGRTMALNNRGDLLLRMGRIDEAVPCYEKVAAAVSGLDRQHQAISLTNMANAHRCTGRHESALHGYREALAIFTGLGDRRSEIQALIAIGAAFHSGEFFGEAIVHYQRALVVARLINDRYGEALALRRMGEALVGCGRHSAAADCLEQALGISEEIGVPYEVAKALEGLASALVHTAGRDAARRLSQRASLIFQEIGLPRGNNASSLPGDTKGIAG